MAVVDIGRSVMTSQILIVEDDPTLAEVLSRLLRRRFEP
jgi:CheY-like chemotaxis protein